MKKSEEFRYLGNVMSSVLEHIEWNMDWYEKRISEESERTVDVESYNLEVYKRLYEHILTFKGWGEVFINDKF